ncbi:chaperonin GroEL, partial [bacterium]|nr:chaperonin GroEL [bacterium]
IIRCGGATEAEVKEKKARVEDALHATRAAIEEGIVPGGGVGPLRAISAVVDIRAKLRGDEKMGADIVAHALEAPLRRIAANAGADGSVVVAELKEREESVGFDGNTGKYVDMFKAGIIDPAKVTRTALWSAASIAGVMLTTETLVTDLDEDTEKPAIAGSVR